MSNALVKMERKRLHSTGSTLWMVGLILAAMSTIAVAIADSGDRVGTPGQSTRRDTANFEEISRASGSSDSSASTARVYRSNGRWVRPAGRVAVPQGAIEPSDSMIAPASEEDALFSLAGGGPPSPAAGASFAAVADDGTRFNPDTQGAVGPSHLMVTLSSQVRVQDKAGAALSTVSLNQFWAGLGSYQVFDPRVLFDPSNQRWIHTAIANPGEPTAGLLIAVSQTANPLGNWYRHFIGVGSTNNIFPDSPNVGFTKDWITVQANMFDSTNFNFFSSDLWAFNKTNLYNGATAAYRHFRYRSEGLGPVNAFVPAVTYDDTLGTNYLVSTWLGDYVDPGVGTLGLLRIFSISGPVNAPVFNDYGPNGLFVFGSAGLYNPPWADFDPLDENFAPQLGTTNKIYIGDARIKNVVYRNATIWCAHHIFLPYNNPSRSSVQWFGMTPGGTVLQRGRIDDSSGGKFFGYPSIAVNQFEDVLLGYTRFGADQYPSANYAFHGFEDFPGTLRADTVLKAGEAPFRADDRGITPWGDWSATVVDPNEIDFWTIQEYADAPVGGQDRWGTWWGVVSPPTSLSVGATGSPNPVLATANVTYTIRVTNNYPSAATGVRVRDTLPMGAVFVSAIASQGACNHAGGVVVCDIGLVPGNSAITATIVARLNGSGVATNQVTVSALGPDEVPSDNTAIVQTTVNPSSDVSLTMVDSPDPVSLNSTLTYQITVSNAGPSAAPGVFVTNTLPAGVIFVSAIAGQGSCSRNGSIVTCTLGTIVSGGSVPVTIRVTPTVSAQLINSAVVTSSAVDLSLANNSASVTTRANAAPTISTISNRTIAEDTSTGLISFTVGDAETAAGSLLVGGFSSAASIVPPGNIVFGGSGSSRTVTVTPALNANGVVTIFTYVTDGDGSSTTNSFILTVSAVNDAPFVSDTPNQLINEDTVLGPIGISVGDVETPAASLAVSATSSNPTLVPNASIVLGGSGGSRTLIISPTTNQFGSTTITIFVNDGTVTVNDTFVLTVNSVNDLPTVSPIGGRSIDEDANTGAMAFTVSDVETPVASLTMSGSSSNPALVPNGNITFGGSGGNRTVTVTPAPDQFGTATITVTATDGNGGTGSTTFPLVVNNVNDAPTLGAISSIAVNEDSGTNMITLTVIGAGAANESQTLSVTAVSASPSIIPNPSVSYSSPATTGSLRFTPAPDATGSAQITVTVDDGGASNNVTTRVFTITVIPVNDPPAVSTISNRTVDEDASTGPIPFSVTDVDSSIGSVNVSAFSSNPTLVPAGGIVVGGSGTQRTIEVTPGPNRFGSVTIFLAATDGLASSTNSFVLTVNPVNDPPTIAGVSNVTVDEDSITNIVVTIGDDESSPALLQLTGVSSNPGLLPNGSITFTGTTSARTMRLAPAADASGAATVTVIVTDTGGLSVSNSFVYSVLPVNDPPRVNALGGLTIAEDSGQQSVPLTGINSGAANELQALTVTAVSGNPSVIPNPAVNYLSPNATGSLSFTPVPDASGSAEITVTVNDGQAANNTFSRMFTVTVTPVNDRPTITMQASATIPEDTTTNLTVVIGDIETAVDALVLQAGSSNEELIDASGIQLSGTGASRVLSLTPLPNQFGSASISVMVSDGSGGSETAFVNLTVLPVNDLPSVSPIADVTINQNASTANIPFSVSDEETFADNLQVTATSSNPELVPASGMVLGGAGFSRTIRLTPAAGGFGTALITVTARDENGGTNSVTFRLTVRVINIPPTLALIGDITIAEESPVQTVNLTGISSGSPTENQTLTVTARSSQPLVIPDPIVEYSSPAPIGLLRLQPRPDATGTVTITVQVDDGMPEDNLVTRTFVVTVTPVNDAPSIAPIANQSTDKNRPTLPIAITIGDLESPASGLQVRAFSSNTGLVANTSMVFGGADAMRTLTITPETNQVGISMISIEAEDPEGLVATQVFQLTVYPVDYPPTISPIADVVVQEDSSAQVNFVIGDEEDSASQLVVMTSSSNPVLLPRAGMVLGGAGPNRTLSLQPAPNQAGQAVVAISVTDMNGTTTNVSFQVTVTPINDPPVVSGPTAVSIDEDTSSGLLELVVSDPETSSVGLQVSAVSQNTTLIPNSGLLVGGSGAVRTLRITPAGNQSGVATIAVTVSDGTGGTVTSNLIVTVNPINDAPGLAAIGDVSINEDAGVQNIPLSGISAGGGESQALVVSATSSNPGVVPHPTVNYSSPNATGSLQFTPVANASGTAVVTVTVNDGQPQNGIFVRTFLVTVGAQNDAPTIGSIGSQQGSEDVPVVVPFTINDAESPVSSLVLTASSTNTSLVAATNLFFNGSGSSRTLTILPSANQSGTTLVTVQVSDGVLSSSSSFLLTVLPVNDPPTLNPIANFVTNAAGGNRSYTIALGGITPGAANESQSLTVTAVSDNPAFLPNPTVNYSSPAATGSIVVRPANNTQGSAIVTVTVSDNGGGNNTFSRTFLVNVKSSGNTLPTISGIGNQSIPEDGSTGPISVTVQDAETAAGSLTLVATSSNPTLVPDSNVVLGGSGGARTVTVSPAANQSGTATITLTVEDAAFGLAGTSFNVTVNAVNDRPTISSPGNQSIVEDAVLGPLSLTVGDAETSPGLLQLTATSSDQALVPNGNLRLGGSGAERTIIINPATNASGLATIIVVASDGLASATNSFVLTVTAANDGPTLSDIPDQSVAEDGTLAGIPFTIGDVETAAGALSLSASSSNPALIPVTGVSFGGSGGARTVSIVPVANASGTATITVTVSDGAASSNDTFLVTVLPVNDVPTLGLLTDVSLNASGGPQLVTLEGISSGAPNESQSLIVTASSSNPAVVSHPVVSYASPGATGTLSLLTTGDASGTATITVTVNDGQAENHSVTRTFNVTVNQAPTISTIANQIQSEDRPGSPIAFTIGDAETPAGALSVSAVSSDLSVISQAGVVLGGTGASRLITLTPVANAFGASVIAITVEDSGGRRTTTEFLATVRGENDRPTLDTIPDLTIGLGAGPRLVQLTGIGSGAANEVQGLTVQATSSNPSIVPNPVIQYTSPSSIGSLTLATTGGATGVVAITVVVQDDTFDDGSGSNRVSRVFTVNVTGMGTSPGLSIELVAGKAVVSWPTNVGPGYVLQSGNAMHAGADWDSVGTAPAIVGGRYTVTNELSGTFRYFRLCEGCSGPPVLSIRLDAGEVVLSWAIGGSSGYELQSSGNVPDGTWSTVAAAPVAGGGVNSVRQPATGGPRFYRLCSGCGN